MEIELTTEQKESLKTYAGQRDSLLSEVSTLKAEREALQKNNIEMANAYTEMENRMNVVKGRIEELENKAKELPTLISKEIVTLESQKTFLETSISEHEKMIKTLTREKEALNKDIADALPILSAVKCEAALLGKVVDHVVEVSRKNKFVIEELVELIKTSSQELVEKNNLNVAATNEVINKLPAMLLELQRTKLIKHKI